jgi:hypothetical protein
MSTVSRRMSIVTAFCRPRCRKFIVRF